jgi:hypothetical protein
VLTTTGAQEYAGALFEPENAIRNCITGGIWLGVFAVPGLIFAIAFQSDALQWVPLVWLVLFSSGACVSITMELPIHPVSRSCEFMHREPIVMSRS